VLWFDTCVIALVLRPDEARTGRGDVLQRRQQVALNTVLHVCEPDTERLSRRISRHSSTSSDTPSTPPSSQLRSTGSHFPHSKSARARAGSERSSCGRSMIGGRCTRGSNVARVVDLSPDSGTEGRMRGSRLETSCATDSNEPRRASRDESRDSARAFIWQQGKKEKPHDLAQWREPAKTSLRVCRITLPIVPLASISSWWWLYTSDCRSESSSRISIQPRDLVKRVPETIDQQILPVNSSFSRRRRPATDSVDARWLWYASGSKAGESSREVQSRAKSPFWKEHTDVKGIFVRSTVRQRCQTIKVPEEVLCASLSVGVSWCASSLRRPSRRRRGRC
jgi:hypothetical protein